MQFHYVKWHSNELLTCSTVIYYCLSTCVFDLHIQGLGINSSCILDTRASESLLERALSDHMIMFVWGNENNDETIRGQLKARGVHGVCYDE